MHRPPLYHGYQQGTYFETTSKFGVPNSFQKRCSNPSNSMSSNFNEEYWCETCDRGFKTHKILEEHKQQHQKCNIDGCQFVAHPKVITKHIQMQHSTGIYKKLAKLNNPEEVQKWLEERKRKYPTKENMEKKAAEMKEKMERGEKMGLKRHQNNRQYTNNKETNKKDFRFNRNNKSDAPWKKRTENSKYRQYSKNNLEAQQQPKNNREAQQQPKINLYSLPSPIDNRKLKPFSGIGDLINDTTIDDEKEELHGDFIIDDEEDNLTEANEKVSEQNGEPQLCGVLSSLVYNYGSSEEDENLINSTKQSIKNTNAKIMILDAVSNKETENTNAIPNMNNNMTVFSNDCNINDKDNNDNHNNIINDDDSGPEEHKIIKTEVTDIERPKVTNPIKNSTERVRQNRKCQNINKSDQSVFRKIKPRRVPNTLLRKLLWKEMRQERNMVLQCIRYIIKNRYFEQSKI